MLLLLARQTDESILHEYHNMTKPSSVEDKRDRLIMAARKLIKNEIKEVYTPMDSYPGTETISDVDNCLRFLPSALKLFLFLLFTGLEPSFENCIHWSGDYSGEPAENNSSVPANSFRNSTPSLLWFQISC